MNPATILILIISWYVVGAATGLVCSYIYQGKLRAIDWIMSLAVVGFMGVIGAWVCIKQTMEELERKKRIRKEKDRWK